MSLAARWKDHQVNWKNCTKCQLCENRRKVALYRGSIPCDILFIGEGPGASEDVMGKPFVGPAGILLDKMIEDGYLSEFKLGLTNLVACLPYYVESGEGKIRDPKPKEIEACSGRLIEIFKIANPKFVVFVGNIPKKFVPKHIKGFDFLNKAVTIIHPGAILRMDSSQKPLAIQNTIVTLGSLADRVEAVLNKT